jgi:hypothetical protein
VAEGVIVKIGGWRTRSVFDRYAIVSADDCTDALSKLQRRRETLQSDIRAGGGAGAGGADHSADLKILPILGDVLRRATASTEWPVLRVEVGTGHERGECRGESAVCIRSPLPLIGVSA